ncbi:MAG: DnaD domain protein [Bacillales bacterium]|nr:DnaD domain protein [Bacillales bacterium]
MEKLINNYYEIRLASLVSNVDKDVIIELYQPLIGAISSIVYLTLVKQKRNESDEDIYSLESLLNNMQLPINSFTNARRNLEAVGLLKTYESVNNDIHRYIFELFAPKTPKEFFNDILFKGLLIQYVGEKEALRLANSYEINTNIDKDKFDDISASFVEIFNPDYDHISFTKNVGENLATHNSKKIASDINIDIVFNLVEENSQIKKESLLEYSNDIKQLATLFNLNEDNIASVIIDSYNETMKPHLNMKVAFNKAKDKAYYPRLNNKEETKINYTNSEINSDTIIANKIKLMEETGPAVFLEYLQNNTKVAPADLYVINSLINLNLPNGIINAIVDYTLTKKNNILDKFFAEKIASGILREGITTTIDAMNYMKSLNKKRKATIGTNTNKKQYKKKEINNIENNAKIDNNNENISDEELAELLSTLK